MKNLHLILPLLVATLALPMTSRCENYTPFSNLNKSNVSMHVEADQTHSVTKNNFITDYGSYDKTKVQAWSFSVSANVKTDSTVEFFFVFKKSDGTEFLTAAEPQIVRDSKPVYFAETAKSRDAQYVLAGTREREGSKLYGWLARVVCNGSVIAADGSSERLKKMAESGSPLSTGKK